MLTLDQLLKEQECPCGLPGVEAGLCVGCYEKSPGSAVALLRKLRAKVYMLNSALEKCRKLTHLQHLDSKSVRAVGERVAEVVAEARLRI